jgi:hypothetical protein
MKAAEFAARRAIKISTDYCIGVGGDVKVITQKGNNMAAAKKKISPAKKKMAYAMAEKVESKSAKAKELKKGMAMLKKKGM